MKEISVETNLETKTNVFQISFASSLILTILGFFLFFIIANSPGVVLIGLLSLLVGGIQVLVDLGWIYIVKINRELGEWRDALHIVATQREQKFFMYPVFIDLLFIVLGLGTMISASL